MITNFELITPNINKDELSILHLFIQVMSGIVKPTKAPIIVKSMNAILQQEGHKLIFNQVRLRRFVNYCRSYSFLPIIATSEGYFVSYRDVDIDLQIKSLTERSNAIFTAAYGLFKLQKEMNNEK
jgi:hypothetical protein